MRPVSLGFAVLCLVASSLFSVSAARAAPLDGSVVLGMERIDSDAGKALLEGKRWALLSHPASRGHSGEHLADLLFRRQAELGYTLVSFFSPEHGFRGDQDVGVPDSIDEKTGLPIYSLYGPRQAPTAAQLASVDGVIIDLQDVGVRYYTFPTTMALVMKAAKASGKRVVVFDRPDPIGADVWEGAILETSLQGELANYYPIPTTHGMTIGELALLYNTEFGIGADLVVVPMVGYDRAMLWDDTGLPWIPPSPALTQSRQSETYSFLGTLEALKLAVGRGRTNEKAFRYFGAPWITKSEAAVLVRRLNALALPGLTFKVAAWTPTRADYEGKLCNGFSVAMSDFRKVEGLRTLISVLSTMRGLFDERFALTKMDRMMGRKWVREALEARVPVADILARIRAESVSFGEVRAKYLLY